MSAIDWQRMRWRRTEPLWIELLLDRKEHMIKSEPWIFLWSKRNDRINRGDTSKTASLRLGLWQAVGEDTVRKLTSLFAKRRMIFPTRRTKRFPRESSSTIICCADDNSFSSSALRSSFFNLDNFLVLSLIAGNSWEGLHLKLPNFSTLSHWILSSALHQQKFRDSYINTVHHKRRISCESPRAFF